MFDQSFTPKNLTRIYHSENKKGVNIAGLFFPEIIDEYENIKRTRRLIRQLFRNRKLYGKPNFEKRLSKLYELRARYKTQKNEVIEQRLEAVSKTINSRKFSFNIEKLAYQKNNKDVFVTKNDAASFFAEKQIQKNIKYTYSVKQADRDLIVPQLRSILQDDFPKFVIKTDIESFYETIDRDLLIAKLNENPILSLSTRKLIARLLREYEKISGHKKGIPRGVGISAYLSELYLKEFDQKIENLDNLIYYARYVDDIVVVIAPKPDEKIEDYFKKLSEFIGNDKLKLKREKSDWFCYPGEKQMIQFDYLGYNFDKHGGRFGLGISKKKKKKYEDRVLSSIEKYAKQSIKQPRKAKKELLLRIKFLTSNTALSNNKGNAIIGIYNSNKWATDLKFLTSLDSFLVGKSNLIKNPYVKKKVQKFSFSHGYKARTFCRFTPSQFETIVKLWKD
ncbi:MAG: hypothetical protein CMG91_06240 [Marinobacter sp.]|nr:hypothetical protein [Marinobacter sp.]